eukprot:m.6400 g.6400  ORF g.6400 m.6400 type:complete len:988 (+) comp2093_c0_seq1:589-3552(+)
MATLDVNQTGLRRLSAAFFGGGKKGRESKEKVGVEEPAAAPPSKTGTIQGKGILLTGASAWAKSFKPPPIPGGAPIVAPKKPMLSDGDLDDDDLEIDSEKNAMIQLVDEGAFNSDWYLDNVPASDANACIKDKDNGAFVITTGTSASSLMLYYAFNGAVKTCTMYGDAHGIHLASSSLVFDCLSELISHYSSSSSSDLPCTLDPSVKITLPGADKKPPPMLDYEPMSKRGSQAYELMTDANIPNKRMSIVNGYEVMSGVNLPSNIAAYKRPSSVPGARGSSDNIRSNIPNYEVMTGPGIQAEYKRPIVTIKVPNSVEEPSTPEIKVDEPKPAETPSSNGILRRIHMAAALKPVDANRRKLRFNEDSIVDTKIEMQSHRGATGYVDEAATAAGMYVAGLTRDQAGEKLRGASSGSFVTIDGPREAEDQPPEQMILVYVNTSGKVQERTIVHLNPKIAFEGSQNSFESLSALVAFYDQVKEFDDMVLTTGSPAAAEAAPEEPSDRRKNMKRRVSTQYLMFESPIAEPWFQSGLSRATANSLIEFEPTGTFVIWDDQDNPGTYVISFVKNGRLNHLNIETSEAGVTIEGADKPFHSLKDLVLFYCSDKAKDTPELGCRLRAPRTEAAAAAPASTPPSSPQAIRRKTMAADPNRPAWLQLNLPKAQSLAPIANSGDGAFVIRSSESRPECLVLSYKYRGQIIYELIFFYGPTVGYSLECAQDKKFLTLNELVAHYEVPRPELKYPLVNQFGAPVSSTVEPTYDSKRRATTSKADEPASPGSSDRPRPTLQRQASRADDVGSLKRSDSKHGGGLFSKPSLRRNGSKGDLQRSPSKGDLNRRNSKLKSFGSKEDLMRRESVAQLQRSGSKTHLSRSTSKRQQAGVTIIRTNGERLDQRAAMQPWCCMNMTKDECMARLVKSNTQGQFLVRRPSDSGFCVLSYIFKGKIEHAHVEDTPNGLHVVKSQIYQPNLSTLIAYYKLPDQEDLQCSLVL